MIGRISPSAVAMLLVVVLTLTTAVVFGASDRPSPDRGVQVAQADPEPTSGPFVLPTPEPVTPAEEPPEPAQAKRPEPPTSPRRANGGSARPVLASAPDPLRSLNDEVLAAAAADFQLAPFAFPDPADPADPGADVDPEVLALEFASAGSSSTGAVEPDPAPTPTPVAPPPMPTPSAVGPDAQELVYPVGAAGDLAVAFDPRGIVEIADVRPAPGWEVRNQASWKKGVKVLFASVGQPETEATIYVQIVERQPVVTVTLPTTGPAG